jgi:type I restriction enzyme S subunit
MKRYPKYKDIRVGWIDKIPEQWLITKIKYNTYVKGRIGWQGLTTNEYIDEGPILVTGTDFDKGKINWNSCCHVSEERYDQDQYIQLKEHDLLITKDGTIGKIALVKNLKGKATLNSGVFVTRPLNGRYDTEFLYWILNSNIFDEYIEYIKSGTTISHLYQNTFIEFSFPLPPIPEQSKVISYLDHKTHQIDTLIDKKQKQIELLKEQRTAIINQAVTKGLNPNVKLKDSGIEWLGEIPEHWNRVKCNHYIYLRHGFQFRDYDFTKDGCKIIKITQLKKDGTLDTDSCDTIESSRIDDFQNIVINQGDILMALTGGTIGKVVRVSEVKEPLLQNYRVGNFFPKDDAIVKRDYLYWVLNSELIYSQIIFFQRETGQPNIGKEDFREMFFALPSVEEQKSILNYLSRQTHKIDNLIEKHNSSIKHIQEYRTTLISETVTGKIDVRDEVIQ